MTQTSRYLQSALTALALAVVTTSTARAIVGGQDLPPHTFSFMAALIDHDTPPGFERNGQYCSGTFIAPQWVLTAASCLYAGPRRLTPAQIDVFAGAGNPTGGDRIRPIAFVVPPHFDRVSSANDLALVQLARAPRADLAVGQVELANGLNLENGFGAVVGWGSAEAGTPPARMRSIGLFLPVVASCPFDNKVSDKQWLEIKEILASVRLAKAKEDEVHNILNRVNLLNKGSKNLCVRGGSFGSPVADRQGSLLLEPGPCKPDEGGPLLAFSSKNLSVQIGVTAFSYNYKIEDCGKKSSRPFYVNVSAYREWIKSTISQPR